MSASSILPTARARAESRMVDGCSITRDAGISGVVDPVTWQRAVTAGVVVYAGKCFFEVARVSNPTPSDVAGDFPVTEDLTLILPANSGDVRVGDVVLVVSAPDHPRDVGRRLRVTSLNVGTQLKSQRCQVEAITG